MSGSSVIHTKIGKKPSKRNTFGHVGVSYDKTREKWVAQITFKGKTYHLGRYDSIEDAISERKAAENKIFGDFLKFFAETYPDNWK